MVQRTYLTALFTLVVLVILSSSSFAQIVEHHTAINDESIANTQSSPITQSIMTYYDYFQMSTIIVDISVVSYLTIDADEDDGFFDKLFKAFQFRIGKSYRATHSKLACTRALNIAATDKERVIAYGLCAHLVQDAISHNQAVPGAIRKTHLFNGMVHSIKEIHDKNLMTTSADTIYSRQILDLAYEPEVQDFLQRVYVQDPVLSKVNIPHMIDFFVKEVQADARYRLGFRSFFALPQYIYWFILVMFLLSVSLLALTVRKIRDGQYDVPTLFVSFISLGLFTLVSLAIYGLFTGNVWSIWETLSQYIFSPSMYFVGVFFLLIGGSLIFQWITRPEKGKNLGNLAVAAFIILIGGYLLTLPSGLTIGNEQAIHDASVKGTEQLLIQGVNYIKTIQDPVGFDALRTANESGSTARTLFIWSLIALLGAILYFTFRRTRRSA